MPDASVRIERFGRSSCKTWIFIMITRVAIEREREQAKEKKLAKKPSRRESRPLHFLPPKPKLPLSPPFSGGYTSHKLIFSSFPPTANHGLAFLHLDAPSSSSSESESSELGGSEEVRNGAQGAKARAWREVRW